MQEHVLAKYASANLRVYAVWLPMLFGDARDKWDGTDMPDVRVRHYWDGEQVVGRWFAQHVDGDDGVAWDVYYLYGPEARWEASPSPLVSSGGTIYAEREALAARVKTLLGE